jgi:small basic protein (TIGR04137 family)
MSLDKSLRSHGALVRHRNVLTRAERVEKLKELGKWEDSRDVFTLPKVPHRKVTTKKIKAAVAAGAAAEGGAAAPGAGAAAPKAAAAPAAKAAAPAKGGAPKGKA